MRRALHLWPVAAACAAAALAFAAYSDLHPSAAGGRRLSRALALQSQKARPAVVEGALADAASTGSATARSQASNLLAAKLLLHGGTRNLAEAAALYRRAIRLDPADDASKFDLELLLALQPKSGRQSGGRSKSGHSHDRGSQAQGRNGAGSAGRMGSGY